MFNARFNKPSLTILAAAAMATLLTMDPSYAGGGRDPGEGVGLKSKTSTISTRNSDGSTTSIFSRNGAKTYTITRTNKKGKVVSKKTVNKKQRTFVTLHNPDGTSTTVFGRDR